MIKEIPELYKEATAKIQKNLLILSPLIYIVLLTKHFLTIVVILYNQ